MEISIHHRVNSSSLITSALVAIVLLAIQTAFMHNPGITMMLVRVGLATQDYDVGQILYFGGSKNKN